MSSRDRRAPRQILHRAELDREIPRLRHARAIGSSKPRPVLNACTTGRARPDAERSRDPSTNYQTPNTGNTPRSKLDPADIASRIGTWVSGFHWSLDLDPWSFHSHLSAAIGSTLAARRAGIKVAVAVERNNIKARIAKVTGSSGDTP